MVSQKSVPPQKAQPHGGPPARIVDAMPGKPAPWLGPAGRDPLFSRFPSAKQEGADAL
jgi:hypothetical protein